MLQYIERERMLYKNNFEQKYVEVYNQRLMKTSIIMLLLTLLLTSFDGLNHSLFIWLNQTSQSYFNPLFVAHLTDFGNASVIASFGVLQCVKRPDLVKRMLFTVLIASLLSVFFKNMFSWPRPAGVLSESEFNFIGDVRRNNSFPSGHTLTAFAVASFFVFSFEFKRFIFILPLFAFFVGTSRVMVGAHWPEDVFFGASLGIFAAWCAAMLSQISFDFKSTTITGFILSLAIAISAFTGRNEFNMYLSIIWVRYTSGVFNLLLMIYFAYLFKKMSFK